ncbi:conserved hypothetical protein [Histoplasma capsulatum H143]|uniref:Uncharacterized protein n=1 Tax=Ajellomyces capsulatus (strain H143) TaxID=544712 RepID=C6HLA9_AJECH|nr:conserved hypothetical protein [Histoplasma capsulatum H143]
MCESPSNGQLPAKENDDQQLVGYGACNQDPAMRSPTPHNYATMDEQCLEIRQLPKDLLGGLTITSAHRYSTLFTTATKSQQFK